MGVIGMAGVGRKSLGAVLVKCGWFLIGLQLLKLSRVCEGLVL